MLSSGENLVDAVYRLVIEEDEKALKEIFKNNFSLFAHGKHNILRLLAKEGKTPAVNFLINKFPVSISEALIGYAQGKHIDQVKDLLRRGGTLNNAIYGYALEKHIDEVEDLLGRGADIDSALHGYAQGRHIDEVEDLLGRGGNIDSAIYGYAQGKHIDEVEDLLRHGASINEAIDGYALGGHIDQVEDLLRRGADIDCALEGYAQGGHIDQVEDLLRRGADINYALRGYAQGGHIDQVKDLLGRGANICCALGAYAYVGYIDQVTDLLRYASRNGVSVSLINYVVDQYIQGDAFANEKAALRTLFFIASNIEDHKDKEIYKVIISKGKEINKDLFPQNLERKVAKVCQLTKENNMNISQAISFLDPWLKPEVHFWFLQGMRHFEYKTNLPREMLLTISAFILNLSYTDTVHLFNKYFEVMPRKLLDHSITEIQKKYDPDRISNRISNFFSNKMTLSDKFMTETSEAEHRCKERLDFYQNRKK